VINFLYKMHKSNYPPKFHNVFKNPIVMNNVPVLSLIRLKRKCITGNSS